DGSEVLELVEEALNKIALAVECEIACSRGLAVVLGWNDRRDLALGEGIDERVSVVSLVTDQGIWVDVFDQRFRARQIMSLAGGEHELDRIAQGVDERMNLGGQSAARPPNRLRAVFFVPQHYADERAQWWRRASCIRYRDRWPTA